MARHTTEKLQYWQDYEVGSEKDWQGSTQALETLCNIKTANASGYTTEQQSNGAHLQDTHIKIFFTMFKMWVAFAKSCIQSGYFAEKEEPGLIRANNNGTISS